MRFEIAHIHAVFNLEEPETILAVAVWCLFLGIVSFFLSSTYFKKTLGNQPSKFTEVHRGIVLILLFLLSGPMQRGLANLFISSGGGIVITYTLGSTPAHLNLPAIVFPFGFGFLYAYAMKKYKK